MKNLCWFVLLLSVSLSFSQENLVGHWTFNDENNLTQGEVGPDLILVGSHNAITDPDLNEGVISIGVGSYYILPHGMPASGGGANVNEYTFVMDVLLPQLGHWFTFYQTDPTNTSDGEVFINPGGQIGVGATGYAADPVEAQKWYRIAIVVKNGEMHNYYIDGQLALTGTPGPIDGRFSLGQTVLLFADENSEDNLIKVNDIKLFSRALSSSEVSSLGGFNNFVINPPDPTGPRFIPYLQSPTPTSIYVCWHDATTTESVVEFGNSEALGQSQSGEIHEFNTSTIWHWTKLTGLEPETVYYYHILSDSIDTGIFQFKTPPVDGKNSGHIRFSVVGDNRTEPDVFKRTMDKMKEKMVELYGDNIVDSVNLVLNVGDIVTNGNNLKEYAREYFEPIEALSPTVPSMVSIGNHEREAQHYYDYMKYEDFGGPQNEKYYSFRYGRVLFVAINSNSGLRNDTQITWLDNLLNNAQQDPSIDWIISFCHHPGHSEIWPDGNTGYIQNYVIPTLNKYSKVDILMYGHSHNYERGAVLDGNLRLMLNGGAGSALDRWRMYGNQQPYPEIQKAYDYYCYSIFDIDVAAKKMSVKSYSLGHRDKYMDNVLFDEFIRDKGNESPPAKPSAVLPENESEVQKVVELKSSPYSGTFEFMSSHFQVTTTKGDYSSPFKESRRDFEDIYWDTGAPDYIPIDMNAGIDLTTFTTEVENERPGTQYWWRVRYRDKNLQWSEWSEEVSFLTIDRRFNQEPNDTPESATQMFTSDTLFANFESEDDVDWYHFQLNGASLYYLASFDSDPGVEPDIELYYEDDLTDNLLSVSVKGLNDAGDFRTSAFFPAKSGMYFAKVFNSGAQSGPYKIRLSGGRTTDDLMVFEYNNSIVNMINKPAVPEGDTLAAAIFPVDDVDFFKIEGQEGDHFEFGTIPDVDLGNRDTDTFIALMNDQAEVLFENDNYGVDTTATGELQSSTFSLIQGTFPSTGAFFLRVTSRFTTSTGTVDLAHPGLGEYRVYYFTTPGTAVDYLESELPQQYSLYQNYPNPFNPETEIKFDLPGNELVTIKVYDVLGKQVSIVLDEIRPAGSHSVTWNGLNDQGQQMPSGLYIISLSTPNFKATRKITLLR